ncbi:hypothetical protein BPAE_0068g00370 [Botrytis paeoniae]|uniref:Uncharacterized protein n=1 Tax=Botrytis paeoniae TaxID=278948 RepID=A0A4Z1FUV8_9HELO|nr:hypothetical protein BPAE_0068g00370 [Botrytis paeoniae]
MADYISTSISSILIILCLCAVISNAKCIIVTVIPHYAIQIISLDAYLPLTARRQDIMRYQHPNVKQVMDVPELQDSFEVNVASSEVPETGTFPQYQRGISHLALIE